MKCALIHRPEYAYKRNFHEKCKKVVTSIGNFLHLFDIKVVISKLNTSNTLSSYSFRPLLVNLVTFIILLLSATLTQFETSVGGGVEKVHNFVHLVFEHSHVG